MSTQLRTRTARTGTSQPRLDDWIGAVNDFMGVAGDRWNDQGGGKRWDFGNAFDNNLVGVTGQNLTQILQHIDDLDLGSFDTNFTRGLNLPAVADRNFDFGGYDLNINTLDGLYFGNDGTGTSKTVGFGFEKMYIQNAGDLFDGARFQLRESVFNGANSGNNYIELTVPNAVTASYAMQLPADQGADGKFLGISGGGGTAALTLAWQDDNTITTGTLAPAQDTTRTVPMNFKSLVFDNVNDLTTNASGTVEVNSTIIAHHAAAHQFFSSTTSIGGTILLQEGSDTGTKYRGWKAPDDIVDSYVLEFPNAEPTNGQVMRVASGAGTSTVLMEWVDSTGSPDTNITTGTVLAAGPTNPRTMDFSANPVTFQDMAGFVLHSNDTGVEVHNTVAANAGKLKLMESVTAGGTGFVSLTADPTMVTSYNMQFPDAPGINGQVLKVTSGGGTSSLVLDWATDESDPGGTDSSIQAGVMGACIEDRTVDIATHDLSIIGTVNFIVNSSVGTYFDSPGTVIRNTNTSLGGVLQLREPSSVGSDYVSIKAPNGITSTYNITLPSSTGGTDQVLSVTGGGGTAALALSWVDIPDRYLTGPTASGSNLPTATETATVPMAGNDILFQDCGNFTAQADLHDFRDASGTLEARVNSLGVTIAGGRKLIFNNAAGDNLQFVAPASITTSGQVYTWPQSLPLANRFLRSTPAGVLSWEEATGGADTNDYFTSTTTMPTASNGTDVNMGTNPISFNDVTSFNVNSSALNTFTGSVAGRFFNANTALSGAIQLFQASSQGSNYVQFAPPTTLANTQSYVLPNALPGGASGYYLHCDNGGVWSWQVPPDTDTDTNYYTTGNNLPSATVSCTIPMNNQSLTVTEATSFVVRTAASDVYSGDGLNLYTRTNSSGLFVAENRRLYFTNGSGDNVALKAPDTITTSGQTYTLPSAFPASSGQVLKGTTGGAMYWDDDLTGGGAGDNFYLTGNNLPTAVVPISADFGSQTLDLQNISAYTTTATTSTRLNTRTFIVDHLDSATGGRISLEDGNSGAPKYATISAPGSAMTLSYTLVLPSDAGADGQLLGIASGGGTSTVTLDWLTDANSGGDNYYFTGTSGGGTDLPQATAAVVVPMNSQTVTFDDAASFVVNSAQTNIRTQAGTLITTTASAGLTIAGGKNLRFNNAGGSGINFVAPSSIPVSGQTYIWPTTLPGTEQYLKVTSGGQMSWDTPPGAADTNYYLTGTVGGSNNLPAATETVNVDFGVNTVNFDQISTFNIDSNSTIWRNQGGATELGRLDTSGLKLGEAQYLSFKAVGGTETTFTSHASPTTASYTLPPGLPGANSILQSDSGGNLTWVVDQVGVGGSERQKDADDLGASGTTLSINFDSGSYDNKRVTFDANCSVDVTATRSTRYTLYCEATGSRRQITWTIGDNDLPLWVDPSNPVTISMEYAPETGWHVHETECDTVQILAATIEAATSNGGSYTLDCGNTYRNFEIVGDINRTSLTWNEFDNLPSQSVCVVGFSSGQTNTPLISGGFMKTGGDPTHAGRAIWTVLNAPGLGQVICARDEV